MVENSYAVRVVELFVIQIKGEHILFCEGHVANLIMLGLLTGAPKGAF
jgi:hypothetical protein